MLRTAHVLMVPAGIVLATLGGVTVAPDAALKCGQPGDPHYIVDGRFYERPPAGEFEMPDRADMERSAIVCWDPAKQVLNPDGTEAVIYVTTNGFMDGLHADLRRIVVAQDTFRARHGRYARAVADLDAGLSTDVVEFVLESAQDGWHARAGSALLIVSCEVYAGSIDAPHEVLVERDPACLLRPEFNRQRVSRPAP